MKKKFKKAVEFYKENEEAIKDFIDGAVSLLDGVLKEKR